VYANEFIDGFADRHPNYLAHKCDTVPALNVPENWDCWGYMVGAAVRPPCQTWPFLTIPPPTALAPPSLFPHPAKCPIACACVVRVVRVVRVAEKPGREGPHPRAASGGHARLRLRVTNAIRQLHLLSLGMHAPCTWHSTPPSLTSFV
jgi:hypothetical protein